MYVYDKRIEHLNRAIHGSDVLFEKIYVPEKKYSRKQFIQIVDVKYPQSIPDLYGTLKIK
jgi:hypothetical protein